MASAAFYKEPWSWALGVVLVVLALIFVPKLVTNGDRTKHHTVVYRVTGTAQSVTISYGIERSGDVHAVEVKQQSLPWTKQVTATSITSHLGVKADGAHHSGTLRCSVTIDSKFTQTAHDSGADPQVLCSAAKAH